MITEKSGQSTNPPPVLYKYLSPDVLDNVLFDQTAKITQMSNTDDEFEVRYTFKSFGGPLLDEMLRGMITELTAPEKLENNLQNSIDERLPALSSRHLKRKFKKIARGKNIVGEYKKSISSNMRKASKYFNSEEASEQYINMYGQDMLCYSMSEEWDNVEMWGKYAGNNSGVVLCLDTSNEWFISKKENKNKIHKVQYFDCIHPEFLSNPETAFGSKMTNWAYQKEWRMYCTMNEVDSVIEVNDSNIYLKYFPNTLIKKIILGSRCSQLTKMKLKRIIEEKYQHVEVFSSVVNRKTAKYELENYYF